VGVLGNLRTILIIIKKSKEDLGVTFDLIKKKQKGGLSHCIKSNSSKYQAQDNIRYLE